MMLQCYKSCFSFIYQGFSLVTILVTSSYNVTRFCNNSNLVTSNCYNHLGCYTILEKRKIAPQIHDSVSAGLSVIIVYSSLPVSSKTLLNSPTAASISIFISISVIVMPFSFSISVTDSTTLLYLSSPCKS